MVTGRLKNKLLSNERGVSLIETLTALMLFAMVATILYSFMLMGTSMYKRVSAESQIRNQGDYIISRMIGELQDAVYVKPGGSSAQIEYVKMAADPEKYVETFTMTLEEIDGQSGVTIRNDQGAILQRFGLIPAYKIDDSPGQSYLTDDGSRAVRLKLTYMDRDVPLLRADRQVFTVQSRIPLARME